MGSAPSFLFQYSVDVEPSVQPHQTGIRRSSTHPDGLVADFVDETLHSCWNIFQRGVRCNPDGNMFGSRSRRSSPDGAAVLGPFEWLTYRQVEDLALRVGSALMDLDLVPELSFPDEPFHGARALRQLALFSKNRVEWLVMEQAANAFGITLVPLYDTLGADAMRFILGQTRETLILGGP